MKVVISASIDEAVNESLIKFCERTVDGRSYHLSKSEVVNEAIRKHITDNGGDGK
jgi:hypothetical protein